MTAHKLTTKMRSEAPQQIHVVKNAVKNPPEMPQIIEPTKEVRTVLRALACGESVQTAGEVALVAVVKFVKAIGLERRLIRCNSFVYNENSL